MFGRTSTGRGQRRSWIAVVVVLCLAALAGCGATPRPAQAQTTAAVVAGAGQTEPRSAVPWRLIGPGWALVDDFAAEVGASKALSGSVILYLVDPQGGRYRLFSWPVKGAGPYGDLIDWSGDARRALFASLPTGHQTRELVEQLNLRTGKSNGFKLPANLFAVGYTRSGGGEILVEGYSASVTGKEPLIRYSLGGRLQKVIWRAPGIDSDVLSSPDGRELITDSYGSMALLRNAGGVIRHLYSPQLCGPVRWWNSATILASCAPHDSGASRMWLIPLSGAKGTPLTPQRRDAKGRDQGDNDLFRLTSGTYLSAIGRRCGDGIVVREEPNGEVRAYTIPGAPDATIVAATATQLLLKEDRGCSDPFPTKLAWYNPVSGKQTIVVSPSRKEIGVLAVIPYYQAGKF
jgi:hypothetical protein